MWSLRKSRQLNSMHRVLSLASSWIFIVCVTTVTIVLFFPDSDSKSGLDVEEWAPLLLFPMILPALSVLKLTHLRMARKIGTPFLDGWFIHLLILALYGIVLTNVFDFWR